MNILILGTSNSLLKNGWTFGLKNILTNSVIDNISIGASPGIQFAALINTNFKNYDLVLFDSIPNDEEYLYKAKNYKNTNTENIIFEILSTISSQTQLFIMGFCNKWALDKESDVYRSRKEMAQKLGAHFIDIRKMLLIYKHIGIYDRLYEPHPAHPFAKISYEIGQILAQEIEKKIIFKKKYPNSYTKNFFVKEIKENEDRLLNLKNSIVNFNVSKYFKEEKIYTDSDYLCLGMYINATGTNCYIEYNNDKNLKHNIDLRYSLDENRVQKIFVPLPIYSKVDYFKVSDICTSELISIPFMAGKSNDPDKTSLQISELIFWKNNTNLDLEEDIFDESESLEYSRRIIDQIVEMYINFSKDKSNSFVNTHHKTCLFYDPKKNNLRHGDLSILSNEYYPVSYMKDHKKFLAFSKNGYFEIDINEIFNVRNIEFSTNDRYFTVMGDGKYLCAELDGRVVMNRLKAREYEMFYN